MLTLLPIDTVYDTGSSSQYQFYENDIVSLYASSLFGSTWPQNVIRVLIKDGTKTFAFREDTTSYMTQTIKVPNTKVTKVHLRGASRVDNTTQATKAFKLLYLDNNDNYIEFYSGTFTKAMHEITVDIPADIQTTSIKFQVVSYYHYGPALLNFYLEYENIKTPSEKIKNSVKNFILNHELIQFLTPYNEE